jgi:hypothetical protein
MPPSKDALGAEHPRSRFHHAAGLCVLLAYGLALGFTNPSFTFLDDEIAVVMSANYPVRHTLALFWSGVGQHEHPPLYDLLFHFWLRLTHSRLELLRWPSIAFFLAGIWFLALTARRVGSWSAYWACLFVGVLWPFGFHYGRLAGWYSFAFFLLALTTHAYFRLREESNTARWWALGGCAAALLYTNYFGWLPLVCFAADYVLCNSNNRAGAWKPLLLTSAALLLIFLPLMPAFLAVLGPILAKLHPSIGTGLLSGAVAFVRNMGVTFLTTGYVLVASESVAPWFWPLSVPAMLAMLVGAALVVTRGPRPLRRMFLTFLCLLAMMVVLRLQGDTPRLLFLAPWMLVPVAASLCAVQKPFERRALAGCLAVVGVVGWFGIFSRGYYVNSIFLDPWRQLSQELEEPRAQGAVILSDEPKYFFYLNQRLGLSRVPADSSYLGLPVYVSRGVRVYTVKLWLEQGPMDNQRTILLERRLPYPPELYARLEAQCGPPHVLFSVPDTAFELKRRYFPATRQQPHPFQALEYDCPRR